MDQVSLQKRDGRRNSENRGEFRKRPFPKLRPECREPTRQNAVPGARVPGPERGGGREGEVLSRKG